MNIIKAASQLKKGLFVRRKIWDASKYLASDAHGLYIFHFNSQYELRTYLSISLDEILANDWEVVQTTVVPKNVFVLKSK